MSLLKHAERELKLAGLHEKGSDYDGMLYDAVMELVKVFSDQGHSGYSANRTIKLFEKVALYEILMPVTGEDSEWNEVSEDSLQNNRSSDIFKDKKTGKSYYLDAILWRTQNGTNYAGSAYLTPDRKITSRQFIKSFPFIPETFYIDVIEEEVAKDDWKFTIKDPTQLEKVAEYYDLKI